MSQILNIEQELSNLQALYYLDKIEVIEALQHSLRLSIKRDVFIANDENGNLSLMRINHDGSSSKITYKAFKNSRKLFTNTLLELSNRKHREKILSMFEIGEIIQGTILDSTSNGFFVSLKGERAFLPLANTFKSEQLNGLYYDGNILNFEIHKILHNKVYVTRQSLKIFDLTIQNILQRKLKMKLTKNGLLLFCNEPYLDEAQKNILQASIPYKLIFKKEK